MFSAGIYTPPIDGGVLGHNGKVCSYAAPEMIIRYRCKGTRQKLLSGFFPLRGGYPPFPLRVFGQDDFPVRGEGATLADFPAVFFHISP